MIWLFWGLLGTTLGGMLLLAVLARRGRSKLRPARPTTLQLLRAAGHSFAGVLWTLSHPLGIYDRHRYDFDYSKDYVKEHERKLEEQRQRSNQE